MKNTFYAFWAKKPKEDDTNDVVFLYEHLQNTADAAEYFWEYWLPPILRSKISKELLVFLAYIHDIGKACPAFQTRENKFARTPDTDNWLRNRLTHASFVLKDSYQGVEYAPHALVSYAILERNKIDVSVCVIAGGHHGLPPTNNQIELLNSFKSASGFDDIMWIQAQDALLHKGLELSGLTKEQAVDLKIPRSTQVLLSGMVILADWIASCEDSVALPIMWRPHDNLDIYKTRFNINEPRPVQSKLVEAVRSAKSPGIFVVEAPMGEGKTEAALAAAEILASKIGCRGIYFALPSQATSNAMLTRVKKWIEHFDGQDGAMSIRLSHGKADLNEEYEGIKINNYIEGEEAAVTVNDWLVGRKKGLLADFAIGTIDHVLMAGLKQKHLALRHLALANKVVVIDECHAYDVYMESYLLKALNWLGAYGVPVIILSATLPMSRRGAVIGAYLNKPRIGNGKEWALTCAYPLITYTDGENVVSATVPANSQNHNKQVIIEKLEPDEDNLVVALKEALANGGCAGVIFNTVKKAQQAFEKISNEFSTDAVELLHGGFIAADRARREKELLDVLGKDAADRPTNRKHIVIGTQIFEQSLDIDFDVMFTQLCPMDLLLQRIGRLHRHNRDVRPVGLQKPICYVTDAEWGNFDTGSKAVYSEYLLMRTCANLPKTIDLPCDIPELVAAVYNDDVVVAPPADYEKDYKNAQHEFEHKIANQKARAKNYQIKGSVNDKNIIGLLDTSFRDSEGEAAVRDGIDSIEVMLIQRYNGVLRLLPWIQSGEELPYYTPSDRQSKLIAGCSVRLPAILTYDISSTINAIESSMMEANIVDSWYKSYWLNGVLVLILDDDLNATIGKYRLSYSEQTGISVENVEKL